jgi:lysophospholipase L1-like esterase
MQSLPLRHSSHVQARIDRPAAFSHLHRGRGRVVDFDAALRDPAAPARLNPAYDSGDHLHPNEAGHRLMARQVDLRLLNR